MCYNSFCRCKLYLVVYYLRIFHLFRECCFHRAVNIESLVSISSIAAFFHVSSSTQRYTCLLTSSLCSCDYRRDNTVCVSFVDDISTSITIYNQSSNQSHRRSHRYICPMLESDIISSIKFSPNSRLPQKKKEERKGKKTHVLTQENCCLYTSLNKRIFN